MLPIFVQNATGTWIFFLFKDFTKCESEYKHVKYSSTWYELYASTAVILFLYTRMWISLETQVIYDKSWMEGNKLIGT